MSSVSVESRAVGLYEVVSDESYDNYIEARHKWGLPGVKCEACGATWANVGISYPTADLSGLRNAERYTKGWPVTWSEFEEARRGVLPLLPPGAIAPPGTSLGPLVGSARGTFPDLTWQNPWTLLVRYDALLRLREGGMRLAGGSAQLKGRQEIPELIELQLEPHGRISPQAFSLEVPPCRVCGREAIKRPPNVIVDRASLPADQDIFRLTDLTTMIVATARAVEVITDLGLRGAQFQEVALQ